MTNTDYSANVRAEVARAHRPVLEVLKAIRMTRPQWDRRMSGQVDWRAAELQAIADALDIPIERLYREPNP